MMISSKGRYALRVMVFLAEHNSDEYVPLKEISEKSRFHRSIWRALQECCPKNI